MRSLHWILAGVIAIFGVGSFVWGMDAPIGAGDHQRSLMVDGLNRTYLVHVPKSYTKDKPTAVVLALHGAAMNGPMMVWFSGLSKKSDEAGFIVVYPSGTGTGPFLTWNAGGFKGRMAEGRPDDVKFISRLLDDLGTVCTLDTKKIYACGMSNGAMMCYRLAAELWIGSPPSPLLREPSPSGKANHQGRCP